MPASLNGSSNECCRLISSVSQTGTLFDDKYNVVSPLSDDNKLIQQTGLAEMLNDASIDRVMAVDTELKVIAWNKTSEIITGLSRNSVMGRLLGDVFPWLEKDKQLHEAFLAALKGHKSYLPADPKHEHRSFYENHFTPLTDAQGNLHGVMNIMHDVSHRIKAELVLSQLNARLAAKNRELQGALSEIASYTFITSTNIKEPLKLIYTSLEKIIRKEGPALSSSSKASFRRMQASISKMNLLLDDVLSVSGINSILQKKQSVNLNETLARVNETLTEKIKEKNAVITSDALPMFNSYPDMMFQLFYHIIDNALKFQSKGQAPVLKISHSVVVAKDAVAADREFLKIAFSDNGIGFEPGEEEKIFGLFQKGTTVEHFAGSGRGLAVCKKIAEMHQGFITAEATPGKGATFSIFLPTISDDELQQPSNSPKQIFIPSFLKDISNPPAVL